MDIKDTTRKSLKQRFFDHAHETRKHHEIDPDLLEQSNQFSFGLR